MESLRINGGRVTGGEVTISGNKNAALPMIAALLLTDEEITLHNVPDIRDVRSMLEIAGTLGVEYSFEKGTLRSRCTKITDTVIARELCAKNRTSILFAAPLLARCGEAELAQIPIVASAAVDRLSLGTIFARFLASFRLF